MRHEEHTPSLPEENDIPLLDIDDLDVVEFSNDEALETVERKPVKENRHALRRNIEEILAERELQRQLSDIFDEDILLD